MLSDIKKSRKSGGGGVLFAHRSIKSVGAHGKTVEWWWPAGQEGGYLKNHADLYF